MKFCDLHNDAITKLSPSKFAKYIRSAEKAGVQTILMSVWTTEMRNPIEQLRKCRQTLDSINTCVRLLLHIEDAWFIDKSNIDEVISLRPFSVGLTWNEDNNLAGGAHGSGGLTALGEFVARKLAQHKIHIDLAHLNRQSFYDVAKLLAGHKLLCTHACFCEVHPHARNLDRGQIQTIVNTGGLIGLTLVGEFLSGKRRATMHDVYKHIAYFIENFGEDNLGIGTDFFGTSDLPRGLRGYRGFLRFRRFLIKRGLSFSTVDKIFWSEYIG